MVDHTPSLHRLARLAKEQDTLIASLLAIYQEQEELGDTELAQFLETDVRALTQLALCRRPRMDADSFDGDIEQIAAYTNVNAVQLARLVQATTAHEVGTLATTQYRVDLPYRLEDAQALFALANREDVEAGGRYDARSAAINIWTHGWHHPGTRDESETMGTLDIRWGNDTCYLRDIECDEGFSQDDLLRELGNLEEKALGRKIHGW